MIRKIALGAMAAAALARGIADGIGSYFGLDR